MFVILIFVVRDFKQQQTINNVIERGHNNLDWLANRCGCDLETEIAEARQEQIAKQVDDKNFNLVLPS